MPQATLKAKSNEGLVAVSEAHPGASFEVLGAWPDGARLRLLVETTSLHRDALVATLVATPDVHDFEVRHADDDRILFEVATPTPEPHGAMADSGVIPTFPLHLEDGWFVGELVASREQLSAFREELRAAGIEHRVTQVSAEPETSNLLTERQREVVDAALEQGYYESPRRCTQTELADALSVNTSVVSRVLHRAEGRIVAAYRTRSEPTP